MNLWIRSQNKEKLLKISGVQYQNGKLQGNQTIPANILIGFYSSYDNEILGEYKTKERALEVLDEIQNKIEDIQEDYLMACMKDKRTYESIAFDNYVYEMPKA